MALLAGIAPLSTAVVRPRWNATRLGPSHCPRASLAPSSSSARAVVKIILFMVVLPFIKVSAVSCADRAPRMWPAARRSADGDFESEGRAGPRRVHGDDEDARAAVVLQLALPVGHVVRARQKVGVVFVPPGAEARALVRRGQVDGHALPVARVQLVAGVLVRPHLPVEHSGRATARELDARALLRACLR